MRAVIACLLIVGCAAAEQHDSATLGSLPEMPPAIADAARGCPAGVTPPKPPPAPRTVEQVAEWGNALDIALRKTEDARTECSKRYNNIMRVLSELMEAPK